MDLVIRGGTAVTADSSFSADIGVQAGKIVQIGGEMSGSREIDARGKLVAPGGVDMHVHLHRSEPLPEGASPRMSDDFYAGTAGAAAGGITTVGSMTSPMFAPGLDVIQMLDRAEADASANAIVDFTLHPIITDPSVETVARLPELVKLGYTSIKFFMMWPVFDERRDDYLKMLEAAGQLGMLTMIHCEEVTVNTFRERAFLAQGKGSVLSYADSRPSYAEAAATARAMAFAEATRSPVYVVHISSAAALDVVRRARGGGLEAYVETRPIYLYLTRDRYEETDGAKYVCFPPLRESADVDAVWASLRAGDIDTVCSDHAPWKLEEKVDPTLALGTFRAGMNNLESMLPMLYSEGVGKGRISVNRWVAVTSTNAAKLFGMFPRKGTIAVGSDADLAVWDQGRRRTIRAEEMQSNSDYDVYEGWDVQGWPAYTISRGEVVFENGRVTGARGRGQRVPRTPFGAL